MTLLADDDDALFDMELPPPVTLADRFGVPPFSVLDRRSGIWQDRRRRWLSIGIRSELGRAAELIGAANSAYGTSKLERDDDGAFVYADKQRKRGAGPHPGGGGGGAWLGRKADGTTAAFDPKWDGKGENPDAQAQAGTSIFDPVLCELVYRWWTAPGWRILDPFAGGSVRGIVAGILERPYMGIDLRAEQIEANGIQRDDLMGDYRVKPKWLAGDSREVLQRVPAATADLVFSCPPYADLEVYSSDPRDLSAMEYREFVAAHREIIDRSCRVLKPNRFACWVISDIRDPRGCYRGLVAETIRAFGKAGLELYNDGIILDPVGSAAVRAARIFNGGRKLTRMHQHLLVFVKGDWKKAVAQLPRENVVAVEEAVAQMEGTMSDGQAHDADPGVDLGVGAAGVGVVESGAVDPG